MTEEHELSGKEEEPLKTAKKESEDEFKVYRRRWAMIILLATCNFSNSYHWISYSVIANIISDYYSVPAWAVDWLALVFMLAYVILIFPATYILDKKGLRFTVLLGIFLTATGAWIKVLSVSPERFLVALLGQTFIAFSFTLLFGVAPHFSAVWFGSNQVSTATGICIMAAEVGVSMGFMTPPLIVNANLDSNSTGNQLLNLLYFGSIPPTIFLFLILFFFQKEPPIYPSKARALSQVDKDGGKNYRKSLRNIITNKGFIFLMISYAIYMAVINAASTLLGQIMGVRFADSETFAGWLGNGNTCGIIVGGILIGLWLDKTHLFKISACIVYMASVVGMLAFSLSVYYTHLHLTFVSYVIAGLFFGSFITLSFEYGVELTYPEPEGTASGLLNMACFLLTILITMLAGWILRTFGDLAINLFFTSSLAFGTLVCFFIRGECKRLASYGNASSEN